MALGGKQTGLGGELPAQPSNREWVAFLRLRGMTMTVHVPSASDERAAMEAVVYELSQRDLDEIDEARLVLVENMPSAEITRSQDRAGAVSGDTRRGDDGNAGGRLPAPSGSNIDFTSDEVERLLEWFKEVDWMNGSGYGASELDYRIKAKLEAK